jgi:hypothetical protein
MQEQGSALRGNTPRRLRLLYPCWLHLQALKRKPCACRERGRPCPHDGCGCRERGRPRPHNWMRRECAVPGARALRPRDGCGCRERGRPCPHDGCGCQVRGRCARVTAVGARCVGVPARVTETRDLGGQLFCRPSASLPRRCDSVDRRCIAQNGAAALRPLAVPARDARPTGGKGRGCCAQDIPAGVFGKPLRAIFRFRRQDIQTPPSPLVGKGGRGDEGQKRTGMQKITHLSQGIYP